MGHFSMLTPNEHLI